MKLTLIYKGVDITDSVNISQCIHEMYCEQHADTLMVKFKNSQGLWDKWGPCPGDVIEAKSGNIRTGKMFIKTVEPQKGYFVLRASSLPQSEEAEHSNSWQKITKMQLANDIANKHGLKLKTYGIQNRTYEYLVQSAQRDLIFFENLCVLEGDSFLVYDGQFILYNESYVEQKDTKRTLNITGANQFHYKEELGYSGCIIRNAGKRFSYTKDTSYNFTTEKTVPIYIASDGEAETCAKNMLRFLNKGKKSGYFFTRPIAEEYAPGTIVNIKTVNVDSYNGKAFITRVRHDFKEGKSKIFFRKPLED